MYHANKANLTYDNTLQSSLQPYYLRKESPMKSYLIKDTTKQERIELIRQWVPADEAMEDCEIDLWDMYRDYIEGKKEIAEINAEFQTSYYRE